MGAASVGPHVRESDLLSRTLLEKQFILGVEEEDGEGAMQKSLLDIGQEMACRNLVIVLHTEYRRPYRSSC